MNANANRNRPPRQQVPWPLSVTITVVVFEAVAASYLLNYAACYYGFDCPSYVPSGMALTSDLSMASSHFMDLIRDDPLLASEARLLQADWWGLWEDFPFNCDFRDVNTNTTTTTTTYTSTSTSTSTTTVQISSQQTPIRDASSFRISYQHLQDSTAAISLQILSLLDSHEAELALLDLDIQAFSFRLYLTKSSLANILFRNSCRHGIWQFFPPVLPVQWLTKLELRSVDRVLDRYISTFAANAQRLSSVHENLTSILRQVETCEDYIRGVISLDPPPDFLVRESTANTNHVMSYNGQQIRWSDLSERTRAKIISWATFAGGAWTKPVGMLGAFPQAALRHYRTEEDIFVTTQKWDVWTAKTRMKWMRVRYLQGLMENQMDRAKEAGFFATEAQNGVRRALRLSNKCLD